jgi:hypothetical protein
VTCAQDAFNNFPCLAQTQKPRSVTLRVDQGRKKARVSGLEIKENMPGTKPKTRVSIAF